MYLLDSDTLNNLFRGHTQISVNVEAKPYESIWISSIVVEEMIVEQGNHINTLRSSKKPFGRVSSLLVSLLKDFSKFQILPYTDQAEEHFQSFDAATKRSGKMDCRIAAHAVVAGLIVVTCNTAHFDQIPGVRTVDWSKPSLD